MVLAGFAPMQDPGFFEDGFESGDFGAWNETVVTPGETATVVAAMPHHGVYSARFTANGDGEIDRAYANVSFDLKSEVYARGYYNIQGGLPLVNTSNRFNLFSFMNRNETIGSLSVRHDGDADLWSITSDVGTWYAISGPVMHQWYCVEFYVKVNATDGIFRMWADGMLVIEQMGLNTTRAGNVNGVHAGVVYTNGTTGSLDVHADCFAVSDSYIGPEESPPVQYELTIGVVGNGTTVPAAGSHLYSTGALVDLAAYADPDWMFSEWTGDLTGSVNPTAILMDGNKTVTANFVEYSLTINIIGAGVVNRNASAPYYYGDVVELTAIADAGWSFSEWSVDLSGSENPTTIFIDGNMLVNATFMRIEYTLTTNVEGSGLVNLNNSGPYYYGDVVELTAVPSLGWSFSGWSVDLSGSDNPATILIDGNKVVNATFVHSAYTLTVNVAGSGVVNRNASEPYYYGDVVELTADPALGWVFSGWSVDLSGSDNPATIFIDGSKVVNATFMRIEYTLTTNVEGSGLVNLNNSGPYHYGDVVELTAAPSLGWDFSGWSADLTGSANPTTIVMDGDKTVNATFVLAEYTLTVNVEGSGSVSLNSSGPYHYGDVVELTANAASGWEFLGWSGDLTGSANPETIVMNGDHTVNATFARPRDLVVSEILLPYPEPRLYTNRTYQIGVNVTNLGDYEALNFNVSLELFYVDGATVAYYSEQTISYLGPGASMVLNFSVDPTLCGSYNLTAAVDVYDVVSELDENNNSVTVSLDVYLAGDVYGDGDVDIFDIVKMATMYGTTVGDPRYDPLCDLDLDGDIDIFDVVGAAGNYGRSS